MKTIEHLKEFSMTHDLESIGLIMTDELIKEWYDCSPLNCSAFATTGGDGVHFSVFTDKEDLSPVVITVPMSFGEENLVIASSIYDFLCLGCRFGFFNLEQLAYEFEQTTNEIESCNEQMPNSDVLIELSAAFNLKPIKNVKAYINEANRKYANNLQLADA